MTENFNKEDLLNTTWEVDSSHSDASFTVRHAGISKVRGNVEISKGLITIPNSLEDASVETELIAASINTRDENRDAHLKGPDFFETETYPHWSFKSTKLVSNFPEGELIGDLTIHGVTKPVTLKIEFNGVATDPYGNLRAGFSGETEISRKEFGLTWNAALEAGGVLVGDKVKISLELSAIKK